MDNSDEDSESDVDIFGHFFSNNNQDSIESNKRRFKLNINCNGQNTLLLVDTGSTINSITSGAALRLKLDQFRCKPHIIQYGNKFTQVTSSKAVLPFSFNNGSDFTTSYLYIVENQNEDIILGMDWMEKKDLVLYPNSRTIGRSPARMNQQEFGNADELIASLLTKYHNIVQEEKHSLNTKLHYKHQIGTGDAPASVTPDYHRSPMENEALEKEVQILLKLNIIVQSNSDWCSPVVLIKKPDGTWRFCVDYRNLNRVTIKDNFPLPLITELLDKLHG